MQNQLDFQVSMAAILDFEHFKHVTGKKHDNIFLQLADVN